MNSQLAPSASEFIPAAYKSFALNNTWNSSSGNKNPQLASMSGMNSSASEWVPRNFTAGSAASYSNSNMNYENHQAVELSSDVPNQADEYVESQEEMVEITWNGSVFFVPKDSINVSDGYTGVDVDDSDHNIPIQSSATKQSEFHENPLIPPDGDKIIPTAAVGYGFNTRFLRCIQRIVEK